jgi:hypothetical protein
VLLDFGEQLQAKPVHPEVVPPKAEPEPEYELRRVKRRRGRRNLANFEKLPVTTQVYELSAEQRQCPAVARSARRLVQTRVGRSNTFPGAVFGSM